LRNEIREKIEQRFKKENRKGKLQGKKKRLGENMSVTNFQLYFCLKKKNSSFE